MTFCFNLTAPLPPTPRDSLKQIVTADDLIRPQGLGPLVQQA